VWTEEQTRAAVSVVRADRSPRSFLPRSAPIEKRSKLCSAEMAVAIALSSRAVGPIVVVNEARPSRAAPSLMWGSLVFLLHRLDLDFGFVQQRLGADRTAA